MAGVLEEGRQSADDTLDPGRLTLPDVQWALNAGDLTGTFIYTARQLEGAAESRILWVDQNVQRGVRPELDPPPPALLPLGDGYPDPTKYVFDADNADDMTEKLLGGQRLYLNPLVWNLRPGTFEIFLDEDTRRLHLYRGRILLPDSHHRHQALIRAMHLWNDSPTSYPAFNPDIQFSIELYFMTTTQEAEYFFEKNQLGKRADRSRSYELSGQDIFAITAKRFADLTPSLAMNVNRVTDRLTTRNPQVVTLSTLRTMAETYCGGSEPVDPSEIETAATRMSQFYELLTEVRPELGVLSPRDRVHVRSTLIADQAVMMHGYAYLMSKFAEDYESAGNAAVAQWRVRLGRLSASHPYRSGRWSGDFLSRANPLWRRVGILQQTKSGGYAVSNTRQTREVAGKALEERISGVRQSRGATARSGSS